MFLMIYLKDKDPTEYNGWEQYIASKIAEDDTSFFPLNKAIVLLALQVQEAADEVDREHRFRKTFENSERAALLLEQIAKDGDNDARHEALEAKVDRLATMLEAIAPPVIEAEQVRIR